MRRSGRRAGRDEEQLAVIHRLEEDIILRRFEPGLRLVEDVLMERYRTSRHFVRQALAQMERLGIVNRTKNIGAAVVVFTREDVESIYHVFGLLIRTAIEMSDLPAPEPLVNELIRLNDLHCASCEIDDVRGMKETNDAFHRALFSICKNRYLLKTLRDYAALTLPMRAMILADHDFRPHHLRQHQDLIAMMAGDDHRTLAEVCVEHLQPSKADYLRYLATLA